MYSALSRILKAESPSRSLDERSSCFVGAPAGPREAIARLTPNPIRKFGPYSWRTGTGAAARLNDLPIKIDSLIPTSPAMLTPPFYFDLICTARQPNTSVKGIQDIISLKLLAGQWPIAFRHNGINFITPCQRLLEVS
jgi:hypothetical protein